MGWDWKLEKNMLVRLKGKFPKYGLVIYPVGSTTATSRHLVCASPSLISHHPLTYTPQCTLKMLLRPPISVTTSGRLGAHAHRDTNRVRPRPFPFLPHVGSCLPARLHIRHNHTDPKPERSKATNSWNSLELIKLFVGPPLIAVIVGAILLKPGLKKLEQAQWSQQKLIEQALWGQQKIIERRIKTYDDMAPLLNQLLCYFCYIGSWKEATPPDIVKLKRKLDELAHISAPLFDPEEFLGRYNALLNKCFATFEGWGQNAKLRTLKEPRRQAAGPTWHQAWDDFFTPTDQVLKLDEINSTYKELMNYLAVAIGAQGVNAQWFGPTRLPQDFKYRNTSMVVESEHAARPIAGVVADQPLPTT